MKNLSVAKGSVLGGLTALTVVALTYLGERIANLPFVPFDVFDWAARALPGTLVTFGIEAIVTFIQTLNLGPTAATAKFVEQVLAIGQFVLGGVVFGVLLALLGRHWPDRMVKFGLLGGLVLLVPVIFIELILGFPAAGAAASLVWLGVVFIGWGVVLARLLKVTGLQVDEHEAELSRRQFLYLVGTGSFAVMVSALGVSLFSRGSKGDKTGQEVEMEKIIGTGDALGPATSSHQEILAARFEPVPGTRPELTSNKDFYRIDINTRPPEVDASTWRLEVGGLVSNPLSLSLEDLRSRPAASQVITLSCISNEIGGDLISTSLWTGVPLKDILGEAELERGVQEIAIQSVDGFYESLPIEEAMDERTLLVYAMNGEPLPVEHGFPLRIYIPNHFGMKQPKWITHLEAIDHTGRGYWVERGWSEKAIVRTTSVIDAVVDESDSESPIVQVGGIAYAGARGISNVEVQVDDGPWEAAELRTPPLSSLTWVQWRYLWRSAPGRHTLRVRAYDGTGQLQVFEPNPPHPNGATGIHSRTVNVRG